MGETLPVPLQLHGFVLAGGKSSRMGVDKALLRFCGRPMVEIAVEKLRGFCAEVTIAGNRKDLAGFAPVVGEARIGVGPGAGIESGLRAAQKEWVMFMPVDVPLVPGELLRRWGEVALREGRGVSYLGIGGGMQPAFCLLQRERLGAFAPALEGGERSLEKLLSQTAAEGGGAAWIYEVTELFVGADDPVPDEATLRRWFKNVNTPEDLAEAEAWAGEADWARE